MRLFESSLRARLLWLVMLALVPAFLLILYTGLEQRNKDIEAARQTTLKIAEEASTRQNQLFAGAQQLLVALAQLPEIHRHDSITCNERLADILDQFRDNYIALTAFKPNGDLFCSAPPGEAAFNIADRKHYVNAMATKKIALGGYVISRLLGKPSIYLSQPVLSDAGEVEALVNVGMDLEWMNKLNEAARLPTGSVLTVFDGNSITLARYPEPAKWLGKPLPEQAIIERFRQTNSAGTLQLAGPDGVTRLYGFLPLSVPDANAYVAVGIPLQAVLASANETLTRNLSALVIVALLALAAAWFGSRRFVTRQLDDLINTTRRLSDGHLDARVSLAGGTKELTELGRAFDNMAGSLEEKETERSRTQRALQASEHQLRQVMEVTGEGIWDWDIRQDLVRHNVRWCQLLGYGEEMNEHPVSAFIEHLHEDDRATVMARVRTCLEGNGHYCSEHRVRRADGQIIWVLDRGDVVERDTQGQPLRMLGSVADITERKNAEEQIRRLNAELEQRVRMRTAELESAARELESFAYSISHDLRTPLRAIDGFSRIVLEDYADKLDEQALGYLGRVRNGVQRMGTLIDELLELSRVGRTELRLQSLDLSQLASEIIEQLRSSDPARDIQITIAPGLTAQGDRTLLRLALQNLLGNAWKYTQHTPDARIEFGASTDDGETIYCVHDNGAGFDMAYAGKLFQPFQRLHRPDEFEGSGVGLATVARIIQRHGGRVWAEAAPGRGASFYFSLNDSIPQAASTPSPGNTAPGRIEGSTR